MADYDWVKKLSVEEIRNMPYVSLMSALNETNRPPGGKKAIRLLVQNTFLTGESRILHIGCNTGSSTLELVHLAKCMAVGVDLSLDMIRTAILNGQKDRYSERLVFQVGDATNLEFGSESFDLSFSAGSMAFVKDRPRAVKELIRVTKVWGFVADIVLYYRESPDPAIIKRINEELCISIQPWSLQFWRNLYESEGLEPFYDFCDNMTVVSSEDVESYSEKLVTQSFLPPDTHEVAIERVKSWMSLFNENHKFLSWAILVFRRRDEPQQISLFGF